MLQKMGHPRSFPHCLPVIFNVPLTTPATLYSDQDSVSTLRLGATNIPPLLQPTSPVHPSPLPPPQHHSRCLGDERKCRRMCIGFRFFLRTRANAMAPPPQHPPTRCSAAASGREPDADALLTTHSQRRLLDPNNSPDFDDCRPIVSTSTTRYAMPASLPTTIPSTPPTNVRRSALPIALFRAFVLLILDTFRGWLESRGEF
ncbi:hypothetical protein R3P38DRAFT_621751 [Favolaschia claudopus]|uniref:Uncharacterized protein n=1 Tax=Favolaschia claudopus TaxID=2862362 RepID=A0AAV9Z7B2_9AGAR